MNQKTKTLLLLWAASAVLMLGLTWSQEARAGCQSGRCAQPLVAISAPLNNASFSSSDTIAISGRATGDSINNADGDTIYYGISRVDIYKNGAVVGTATLSAQGTDSNGTPFRNFNYTLPAQAAGSYTVGAKAVDTGSSVSTVETRSIVVAPNVLPSVGITTPATGTLLTLPASVTLTATASDPDGSVTSVQYVLANGTALSGVLTTPPYSFTWAGLGSASYDISAKATDNKGATAMSAAVRLTGTQAPMAAITTPPNHSVLGAPATLNLNTSASDCDGSVVSVQYYAHGSAISGVLSTAPYSFTWAGVPAGSYSLTARAIDNQGAATTSAPVSVNIAANAPGSGGGGAPGRVKADLSVGGNGAAQYVVPIQVPPGTAGMVPVLSLAYDSSNANNGWMGVGWSLAGLDAVTRCPRDFAHEGVRAGVTLTLGDRFCLGGQRLALIGGGAYGEPGTEYRTEVDSFSRIVAVGGSGRGPASFRVTLRNGSMLEYGGTADAQMVLPAPADAAPVSWALSKATDARGNYFTVSYDRAGGQQLPARIDYTGNLNRTPTALAPYNSVRFVYTHDRSDVELHYVLGAKVTQTARLSKLQTYAGAALVREYRLGYESSTPTRRSRVGSISECAGDGTCLPATTLAWEDTPANFSGSVLDYAGNAAEFGALYTGDSFGGDHWVDLNGDGRADHCIVDQIESPFTDIIVADHLLCALTQPAAGPQVVQVGSFAAQSSYSFVDVDGNGITDVCVNESVCYYMTQATPPSFTHFAVSPAQHRSFRFQVDVNGDGRTDQCGLNDGGVVGAVSQRLECYLRTDSGYGPVIDLGAVNVPTCTSATCESLQFAWADVSGDGIPSFCRIESGSMQCRQWTPAGLAAPIPWPTGTSLGSSSGGRAWVDSNGDGKADFCRVINDHLACTLATGQGFGDTIVSGAIDVGYATVGDHAVDSRKWVDVNNDGKADFCRIQGAAPAPGTQPPSTTDCIFSTGTGFAGTVSATTGELADPNGDGKTDACYRILVGSQWQTRCATAAGGVPDLLKSVTDGLGAVNELVYRPLSGPAVYTKGSGSTYPVVDVQDATAVVQKLRSSDGIGGTVETAYRYEGTRLDLHGRGSLGFAAIERTEPAGPVTRTETRQDFPYTGMPARESTRHAGVMLSERVMGYTAVGLGGSRYAVNPTTTTLKLKDLNGAFINWVETVFGDYDEYAYPRQVDTVYKSADGTADGHGQSMAITYQHDAANWVLGLPQSTRTPRGARRASRP